MLLSICVQVSLFLLVCSFIVFFKQKTAYEMRISDWSSDVCSSDLPSFLKGGFIGVDIFFVISGFLISSILLRELNSESFSIARFYTRRVARIFPALTTVLIACLAFGWLALLDRKSVV